MWPPLRAAFVMRSAAARFKEFSSVIGHVTDDNSSAHPGRYAHACEAHALAHGYLFFHPRQCNYLRYTFAFVLTLTLSLILAVDLTHLHPHMRFILFSMPIPPYTLTHPNTLTLTLTPSPSLSHSHPHPVTVTSTFTLPSHHIPPRTHAHSHPLQWRWWCGVEWRRCWVTV